MRELKHPLQRRPIPVRAAGGRWSALSPANDPAGERQCPVNTDPTGTRDDAHQIRQAEKNPDAGRPLLRFFEENRASSTQYSARSALKPCFRHQITRLDSSADEQIPPPRSISTAALNPLSGKNSIQFAYPTQPLRAITARHLWRESFFLGLVPV